jgi:hypothetical protein
MPYVTVFEISQKPFEWHWASIGLLFVALSIGLIKFGPRWSPGKDARILGCAMLVFASCLTLIGLGITYSERRELLTAYSSGQYSMAEGVIEDFRPMPYEGHQDECFRVEEQRFSYSDYEPQAGFNQSASHGGPIRSGLPVRIAYIEDENFRARILRLEIRAGSVVPEAERLAFAGAQKTKWDEGVESAPGMDRRLLAFSFATLLISICWNLDWRHYIRYWIRSGPPYRHSWKVAFRIFFLLCLVGSSTNFVRMIFAKRRTPYELERAALDGLLFVGVLAVVDFFYRRWLRARDRTESDVSDPVRNS